MVCVPEAEFPHWSAAFLRVTLKGVPAVWVPTASMERPVVGLPLFTTKLPLVPLIDEFETDVAMSDVVCTS